MKAWRLVAAALSAALLLGIALPVCADGPMQVWVDDGFCSRCSNGGHEWGVDAFDSVSKAVSAVAPGGVVYVLSGFYRDDLRVDRPCRIVGEGPGSASLSPRYGSVTLTVAANDVTVEGLEVLGGTQAAILVLGPAFQLEPIHGVAIRHNTVRGGLFGIAANIGPDWAYGSLPATDIEIAGNTVSECTRAVYVYNSQADIANNNIGELQPDGIGIYSSRGSISTVRANSVDVAVPNGRGIYILDNQGTTVEGNTLVGTAEVLTPTTALALYGYADLSLTNNTIRGFYWGATAYTGGTARLARNTFDSTMAWAVSVSTAVTATEVTIEDNVFRGTYWGLKLDDDGGYGLQANVHGNSFDDNIIGVQLGSSLRQDQVQIHGNAICGNLVAGVRNESDVLVDATDNWWGANDGPGPSGSGDRLEGTGGVTTYPWLRLTAYAQPQPNGQVLVTAYLGNGPYRLRDRRVAFTTDSGSFLGGMGPQFSTSTDWQGQAQATLLPLRGLAASVVVSSDCGLATIVSVRPQ